MQRVTSSPVFSPKRSRHILFCGGGAGSNCFDVLRFLITASTPRFPPNQAQPISPPYAGAAAALPYAGAAAALPFLRSPIVTRDFRRLKPVGGFGSRTMPRCPRLAAAIFNVAGESAL